MPFVQNRSFQLFGEYLDSHITAQALPGIELLEKWIEFLSMSLKAFHFFLEANNGP